MAAASGLLDEFLREAASVGDERIVMKLIRDGVDVNSQNSMNGWTALHWAAVRNNKNIVDILIKNGANSLITNWKGETPASVTSDQEIRKILGEPLITVTNDHKSTFFTPAYLKYPALPICNTASDVIPNKDCKSLGQNLASHNHDINENSELTLKVRIADREDTDFIEIELSKSNLTVAELIKVSYEELEIKNATVKKIRKLPNVIIRKDKDVQKLSDNQEIELILDDIEK